VGGLLQERGASL